MKFLVINGPNINMLGIREPAIYGSETYSTLIDTVRSSAEKLDINVDFFQSNHEGEIVDKIQSAYGSYDGIVINPAAFTHTSIAIPDAIKAVGIPSVEVHISDISNREEYRKISYTREACIAQIKGKGIKGYVDAIALLKNSI